jgi:hypothetical protein
MRQRLQDSTGFRQVEYGKRQRGKLVTKKAKSPVSSLEVHYDYILGDISNVIDMAKRSAARSVNCIMTAAYWLIGRRIVESEQKGEKRAAYGEELLERLSADLGKSYGRGFSRQNLQQMRQFYLLYIPERICQTPSGKSARTPDAIICQPPSGILQTLSGISDGLVPSSGLQNFQPPSGTSELLNFQEVQSVASPRCPGPLMYACSGSRTNLPGSSTRPKPCAAAGRCGSSTDRSTPNSTNGQPCPGTRPPC